MPEHDPQRLEIANNIRIGLALENELSADQARAYVRCLQTSWQVPTIQWADRDSREQLADARRLIHAAGVLWEIEGPASTRAVDCYRRAGEIFEWLARAADKMRTRAPIELFAAAAFQLGGLPAMANALLAQLSVEGAGSGLYADFLRADFDGVLAKVAAFWREHPELTQRDAASALLREEAEDRIGWYFTVELVRALGLFADALRRDDGTRLIQALAKLKALDAMALRTFSDDVSLLVMLLHLVGQGYAAASIYRPAMRLADLAPDRAPRLIAYAREQFSRGRGILWSSQQAGLDRLLNHSSFALCTPTGSGKTLVANLALVKELLLRDHGDVMPLALYLVPSRALAGEVEAKLHAELGTDLIITGLYGGADWGITDYWLDADKPTVLIATVEKADALMRYLAPLILKRLRLLILDEAHQVVPEANDSARVAFAEHGSRPLRLENFVARLLARAPDLVRIALTAVAGGAAGPVARWVENDPNAQPIGLRYRSTRQVIGVLQTAPQRRCTMLLDLMNGKPLYVQGRGDPVYLNLTTPPMPQLPGTMRNSIYRFNQLTVLWTALHLVEADRRILISLAQQPEQTMRWFKEALDLPAWQALPRFLPPEGWRGERFAEARAACVDYCGENAFEVVLLDHGIATSHGQMPQRLRRLMTALIDERICPITVATATLTEGVNLPFDIIFVTALKRSAYDAVARRMVDTPYTAAEFRNLAGRAGRPGATRGMEGLTLVALPTAVAASAPGQQDTQLGQMAGMASDYDVLREALRLDELAGDAALGPLALLLETLRDRVRTHYRIATDEAFLAWLEAALPETISDEAGTGATDPASRFADSLDELDAFLLTAIEEVARIDDGTKEGAALEADLAALWRRTFTFAAQVQEDWLERAIVRRGQAIVSTIYPDADERRRLYQYGFSPYVGQRFEAIAPAIREGLEAAIDYGQADAASRLSRFVTIGRLLTTDRGFGFRIRDTQTDRRMLENWNGILGWWMHVPGAVKPEPADLRAWQRFVSDNLEFRLGVAIGAVVAQSWSAGADDPLAIPSLEAWRETTGLPWFGFWGRELLRWGTLDPFVAFALAQGRAKTRDDAVLLRIDYNAWLAQEIDRPTSEDCIDPQLFLRWERALPRGPRDDLDEEPEAARLTGTTGNKRRYSVLPIAVDGVTRWIDPAGYELARSDHPAIAFDASALRDDFILNTTGRPSVDRTFRSGGRR